MAAFPRCSLLRRRVLGETNNSFFARQNLSLFVLRKDVRMAWVVFQTHAGYSMHDYSHRAVTHNANLDYIIQLALFSFQSGFSSNFWTEYHSRHHSKPNLVSMTNTLNPPSHVRPRFPGLVVWRNTVAKRIKIHNKR